MNTKLKKMEIDDLMNFIKYLTDNVGKDEVIDDAFTTIKHDKLHAAKMTALRYMNDFILEENITDEKEINVLYRYSKKNIAKDLLKCMKEGIVEKYFSLFSDSSAT